MLSSGLFMDSAFVITSLGVANALGTSVPEVRERLFSGDQSFLSKNVSLLPDRGCFVGVVRRELPGCPPGCEKLWSRNAALSLLLVEQIRDRVATLIARYGAGRIGVVVGSSTSGVGEGEAALLHRVKEGVLPEGYFYSQQEMGSVSEVIAALLGVTGPQYTVSTACSSSAKVIRAGIDLLNTGLCDGVITGGVDSLCRLTVRGFSALELVSEKVTNPFSKHRDGITIGEGGALFVLERQDPGSINASLVRVYGVGESSDAYHISSPDPSGEGASTAIRMALHEAGIAANKVDYLNLHGTGTPHNDAMEAKAVHEVFPEGVLCSSTKPLVGHMLGASGATEMAFCWMVLTDPLWRVPPHRFDGVHDPELPLLRLAEPEASVGKQPKYALSNSFGFGGSNCAVVLGVNEE